MADDNTESSGGGADLPAVNQDLEDRKKALAQFLERNPFSTIESAEVSAKLTIRIVNPWGDSSLAISINNENGPLIEALNNVLLPERFSALWHADTKRLEIIWTALRLSETQKEIDARKFQFQFRGKKHDCHFGRSSDRLLEIAKCTFPRGMSSTQHRNMQSFTTYMNAPKERMAALAIDQPKSFWITNIQWNENKVIDIISNLNFYLTYYDDRSPTILIHPPASPQNATSVRTRYIHGSFPSTVSGEPLNDNLLGFWSAAEGGNSVMRFILYYRIIEYAAHHYVDEEIRSGLTKLLSIPHIGSKIPAAIDEINELFSTKKTEDIPKLKSLIGRAVDPKMIWREAQANKAFFSKPTRFEGGFVVKQLLQDDDKESGFCHRGLDGFCDLLRKIRNALSHGRDQETGGVITPTTRNFQLLRPWVHLIGTAAGEVVIYRGRS